eukprot:COSAG06_NODE_65411_length_257_cov_0.639241_1_plen_54_part_10
MCSIFYIRLVPVSKAVKYRHKAYSVLRRLLVHFSDCHCLANAKENKVDKSSFYN